MAALDTSLRAEIAALEESLRKDMTALEEQMDLKLQAVEQRLERKIVTTQMVGVLGHLYHHWSSSDHPDLTPAPTATFKNR